MKLYIVGPVASGKSTLARQLSRETGIPCFHLDQVARRRDPGAKVGNRKRTDEEREAIFQAILAREDYILEDTGRPCFAQGLDCLLYTSYTRLINDGGHRLHSGPAGLE